MNETDEMPKLAVSGNLILNAIRKANDRLMGKQNFSTGHTDQNGDMTIKYSFGYKSKEVVLTRDKINAAWGKALSKYAKGV